MPDKKEEDIIVTPRDMGIPMREPSTPRKKKSTSSIVKTPR